MFKMEIVAKKGTKTADEIRISAFVTPSKIFVLIGPGHCGEQKKSHFRASGKKRMKT